ncbi:hypothetical protein L6V77_28425 [Myxococcota bacterium]|nr:hypothetical protein [Myxococcota bacterium]
MNSVRRLLPRTMIYWIVAVVLACGEPPGGTEEFWVRVEVDPAPATQAPPAGDGGGVDGSPKETRFGVSGAVVPKAGEPAPASEKDCSGREHWASVDWQVEFYLGGADAEDCPLPGERVEKFAVHLPPPAPPSPDSVVLDGGLPAPSAAAIAKNVRCARVRLVGGLKPCLRDAATARYRAVEAGLDDGTVVRGAVQCLNSPSQFRVVDRPVRVTVSETHPVDCP